VECVFGALWDIRSDWDFCMVEFWTFWYEPRDSCVSFFPMNNELIFVGN